jgi:hypothetical protein
MISFLSPHYKSFSISAIFGSCLSLIYRAVRVRLLEPMRRGPSIALLAVAFLASCARTIRSGTLIDQYSRAQCVPVTLGSGTPARTWDYTLETREGNSVHVSGMAVPGGRIDARYASDGKDEIVANAGDYIYPADVRFDRTSEHLYVKASGFPAVFGGFQTWLFEYDLRHRRQTGRARVDPSVLPQECPVH